MRKNKTFFHFFFAKNKPVESTDREAGLPDATSTEVSSQNSESIVRFIKTDNQSRNLN
jgi:hypothetical protein